MGAIVGLLAGAVMGSNGRLVRIEDMAVGVFGAFIGGEFLPSVLAAPGEAAPGFSGLALAGGIAGAAVMLVLLRWMRGAVGPMKNSKSRQVNRR